ncbi:MAG: ECF transporter S component [Clostridia bacterium]|nr:ECF transporter S component [Clostridia bacterium]
MIKEEEKRGERMTTDKLHRTILAAVFAALTCVATMVIRVPTVAGYTNLGDGMVLLGAFVLGPGYGLLAGGLGSALADLLAGYLHYVPGTFFIKGGSALIAALLAKKALQSKRPPVLRLGLAALTAELFMAAGYFLYKAFLLGRFEAAVASIPANLVQGVLGIVLSVALYKALSGITQLEQYFWKGR